MKHSSDEGRKRSVGKYCFPSVFMGVSWKRAKMRRSRSLMNCVLDVSSSKLSYAFRISDLCARMLLGRSQKYRGRKASEYFQNRGTKGSAVRAPNEVNSLMMCCTPKCPSGCQM